ncbi:MAG: narR1 [Solirubrobacterales bacterium]|nr:narR1 [Solirubrobacterales bacterium]
MITGSTPGRRRRADSAYDMIRESLLTDRWPAHSLLSTYALAEELGMSRTPVSEALKRLDAEGLVEVVPQVGCRVVERNGERTLELVRIVAALEGLAAELAADRVTAEELARLQEILVRAERTVRDRQAFGAATDEFRDAVVAAAGSTHLRRLIPTIGGHEETVPQSVRERRAELAALREVTAALAARDGASARTALERHLRGLIREVAVA